MCIKDKHFKVCCVVYFVSVRHFPPEPHVLAGICHVGASALGVVRWCWGRRRGRWL